MRKALTFSAIAVVASFGLAAPTVAFAADSKSSPASSKSAPAKDDQQAGAQSTGSPGTIKPGTSKLSLSTGSGKPGAKIDVSISAPLQATSASVDSPAFGGAINLAKGEDGQWHGTATLSGKPTAGTYKVSGHVGNASTNSLDFTVQHGTPHTLGQSTLSVTPGSGEAGDKIAIRLDAPSANPQSHVSADSLAFGGRVKLTLGRDGKWHGIGTVAHVKNGQYKVTTGTGANPVTFAVTGKGVHPVTPANPIHPVKPVKPSDYKTPKGSVNTGKAPATRAIEGANSPALALGAAALCAAALVGASLHHRRHNND